MRWDLNDPLANGAVRLLVPVLVLGLFVLLIAHGLDVRKCERMAAERGFVEAKYIPSARGMPIARCDLRGKRNPDGTVDADARLSIPMD